MKPQAKDINVNIEVKFVAHEKEMSEEHFLELLKKVLQRVVQDADRIHL